MREARAIQERLRERVLSAGEPKRRVRFVAGVDAAFDKRRSRTRAAVAVLRYPELALHEHAHAEVPTTFPYVPGYLSFREIPAICAALEKLGTSPDLVLCDGQGYAHPRRFGLACHLGVLLDIPCIGVGKSRLLGTHAEPATERGSWTPLMDGDEVIGAVLRTRPKVRPVYVSVGHRIGLRAAIRYVMGCVTRYRLPETTRFADRLASGRPGM